MRTNHQTRKISVPSRGNARMHLATHTDSHELVLPEREPAEIIPLAPRLFIPLRAGMMATISLPATDAISTEPLVATLETIEIESHKRKLALLLPGHNEELIIAATIDSAIASGQAAEDIYVVDDNSSDATREIAISKLGEGNVLSVERSGKALAVKKAIDHFDLVSQYSWVHVADADSVFSSNYFREYTKRLDEKRYAVAVGFVQSLRGNWISTYRALTYTYSQHVTRRAQSYVGMISVFPGPVTCFRTDILSKLDFETESLTEDFDVTLQVHRKQLGKILYIPNAINYTQDPQSLQDFCKQNLRWQRGFFQGVKKYRIGTKPERIDISLGLQILQTPIFLVELLLIIPLFIASTGNWLIIPIVFSIEIIMNGIIAITSMMITKRWNLIGSLPYFYFLRFVEIGIHLTAFVEVMLLHRFNQKTVGWMTEGRRYALSSAALSDVM